METSVEIFQTPYELAEKFAGELVKRIANSAKTTDHFTIALSGGSTPELLFTVIGDHFSGLASWDRVAIFWGDERCVPPESPESNYGMTEKKLLRKINISPSAIHRIKGEDDPEKEALRYSDEISQNTRTRDGIPVFDLVILGLGEDGHTASIFPENKKLLKSSKICEVSSHPVSKQKRITITGRVINNADSVVFLVTGTKKADIVEKIINKRAISQNFPASCIVPEHGRLRWLIDKEAASLLKK